MNMATRKHKMGVDYQEGHEINFYYQGEVLTGVVVFVGEGSVAVRPYDTEEPSQEFEINVSLEDIV